MVHSPVNTLAQAETALDEGALIKALVILDDFENYHGSPRNTDPELLKHYKRLRRRAKTLT